MPSFNLDLGSRMSAERFKALDSFTQGYIEAMFFTSTGTSDDEELEYATLSDLSDDAWTQITTDCDVFRSERVLPKDAYGRTWLDLAYDYAPSEYDETYAGHDFWYTRNHHGTGYWDRGFGGTNDLGTIGCALTKAAQTFKETSLYLGDDGLLYLA